MKVQTLIATMNLKSHTQLVKEMRVQGSSVTINQVTKPEGKLIEKATGEHQAFSFREKGLSRSRNKALAKATGDICLIADDDMQYTDDYLDVIKAGFQKYPDADIIAFRVDNAYRRSVKKPLKAGRLNLLYSLKLSSVQLAFKRASITQKGITFNERFGAGTDLYMGEENIFLADCLRAGLTIYSHPVKIADLQPGESTWFQGYNQKYLEVKGRVFYKISNILFPLQILQFAIRKRRLYNKEVSVLNAIRYMFRGAWREITSHEK